MYKQYGKTDGKLHLLRSRSDIHKRVEELGRVLSQDYSGRCPVAVCVLNGGVCFFADLVRNLCIDCELDFIKISSYGHSTRSSGSIHLSKDLETDVSGRDVLLVEDIIDTGNSLDYLKERILARQPRSLKVVSLLVREGPDTPPVDYTGFTVPGLFVVGYGMDYAGRFRNLPDLHVMRED